MTKEIMNNKEDSFNRYFYVINYHRYEKELCEMEMRSLFEEVTDKKYILSNRYIDPSRSPFIKHSISIKYCADSLEEISYRIKEDNVKYDDFKVIYIKSEDGDVEYEERIKGAKYIGCAVTGSSDLHKYTVALAISKIKDKWIFGEYKKNDGTRYTYDDKPYSYSNALSIKVAQSIVNIAVGNELECRLIDPCCGVGTVVIEALNLGINVSGCELNEPIALNARGNLEYFGYNKDIITIGDMHTIKGEYDVAIVDIPYGLFSSVTLEEQINIIKTSRRIAKKLVLITFEDMDNLVISAGFNIVDQCCIHKNNNFKRYVSICK